MPRKPDSDLRKDLNWAIKRFKESGLAIGAVRVDLQKSTFTIFTPEAAKAEVDEFEQWAQNQETENERRGS